MTNYSKIQKRYDDCGLGDYRLRDLGDVENVHGIKLEDISGFEKLSRADREVMQSFIVFFMNRWGLEARDSFVPLEVRVAKSKEAGRFLKFVYRMNGCVGWLHVKGASFYY